MRIVDICYNVQSMTLKEACAEALKILKQVMEEKLDSTNIEVFSCTLFTVRYYIH